MLDEKIIGKGTWIDKLASELIKREKKIGRNLDLIRVESGLGASGIPHIGSLGCSKSVRSKISVRKSRIQIRINCIFR